MSLWTKIKNLDWYNPRVILTAACAVVLPFAAEIYLKIGVFMGLLMCVSILWLVDKLPQCLRRQIRKHPLLADAVLSVFAISAVAGIFGTGLTLGIAAVFAATVLSWALPRVALQS